MLGKIIKEELSGYDLTILFSKDAGEKEILKFFSGFFDDKDSYYVKSCFYCGFAHLAYKIKGGMDARVFSVHFYCLPSKIKTFVEYSKRSSAVMRILLLNDNLKEGETFIPFTVVDREEDTNSGDFITYRDLVKNIIT